MTSEIFQGSSISDYFSVLVENLYIVSPFGAAGLFQAGLLFWWY